MEQKAQHLVFFIYTEPKKGENILRNGLKIAFVYIGLIIGAGFASGREILEYFNMQSRENPFPILLAVFLFALVSFLILNKTYKSGISDFSEFVDLQAGRLSLFVKAVMYLFMFCGFFVMLSASGSLFASAFGFSERVGVVFLALICFLVFSFDIKGIVAINTVLVPFMIFGIVYLSVSSLLYSDISVSSVSFSDSALVNAVCYVSYNTITAGAVLVPLCSILDKKSIRTGVIVGSGVLGVLIFLIWITLNIFYEQVVFSDMPLFEIASLRGEFYQIVYTFVLFTSICTTAVSHGFGVLSKFKPKTKKQRILLAGVFCLAAMPFSDLNFSFLVSALYSVFGYFGLIWLIILIIRK